MNNVQLFELTALPKSSTSKDTSITIPAENSFTTNTKNNVKFKNYFINHFAELS